MKKHPDTRTENREKINPTKICFGKTGREIAEFPKTVYRGGFGIKDEKRNVAAWYAEDGIHLAKGNAAQYVNNAQVISWKEAAERIGQLWKKGNLLPMWNWQKHQDMRDRN